MDIQRELMRALQLHQSGQLLEAAEIYRDIIKADPTVVDAWNLLSAVFFDTGEFEAAVVAASQAAAIQPDFFVPYVNLGNALQATGRLDEAIKAFQKAIDLSPESPESHNNLASALNAKGRYDEALAACKIALAHRPDFIEAYNNRGNAEAGLGQPEAAAISYRTVLAQQPDNSDALYNLGGALLQMGEIGEAIRCYQMAVMLEPDNADKHFNLGNALQAAGNLEDAETNYRNALQIRPDYVDAINNLASVVQAAGRLDEAEAFFRQALVLEPDSADVHWNLALALLQKGDYVEGWREYEWRWKNPAFTSPKRDFEQPQWSGDALDGATILLHAEQGFGDTLQFSRYAPLVKARGGRVLIECRAPLKAVLETLDGAETIIAAGDQLPDFDCHLPLMSLPHVFGTTLDSVPAETPYLRAPSDRIVDSRISAATGLKVGIVWSGSATRRDNALRTVPMNELATLFDLPDVTFFSLQVGDATSEIVPHVEAGEVVDLGTDFQDFADTAAAVAGLDLILSVDTAVTHLAGAMAKPVWVMLAFVPGYLWMIGREDTPWYPDAKLIRQPAPGDWTAVVSRVKEALRGLSQDRNQS